MFTPVRKVAFGSIVVVTAFDPNTKAANVVVSNGNHDIAVNTAAYGGAKTNTNKSTGKWYFEFSTVGTSNVGSEMGVGLITAPTNSETSVGLNNAVVRSSGLIFNGGVSTSISFGGPMAQGDVCCVALDLTNKMIWFRLNGGNWNGDPTANPATNVGGIDISTWVTGAVYGLAVCSATNNQVHINAGPAFAQAKPAGFANFA
jgi:hypothetical protein